MSKQVISFFLCRVIPCALMAKWYGVSLVRRMSLDVHDMIRSPVRSRVRAVELFFNSIFLHDPYLQTFVVEQTAFKHLVG